jgi:hypothetical protein
MAFFWLLTTFPFLYVLLRAVAPLRPFRWPRAAAAVCLFLVAFKFQLLRLFAGPKFFAPDLPRWFMIVTSWLYVSFLFFAALLAASDLVRLAVWVLFRILGRPRGKIMARPGLATLTPLLVAAFLLAAWGMVNAKAAPAVLRVEVARKSLPPELDGFTIVLLADLHVDKITMRAEIEELVRRANALGPDLIVLAGDFVDGDVERLGNKLEPLKKLRAKYGVYGIPGNHEYYSGYYEWMAFLRTLGIDMLENENRVLADGKLTLAGVTDHAAKIRKMEEPDVKKALAGAPEGSFKILLAHQLNHTREAAAAGADLQLSGHTHGGMIVGLDRFLALLNHGFVSGGYDVGGMKLYVSRGTSLWKGFPVRLGVPAEITLITLHCE